MKMTPSRGSRLFSAALGIACMAGVLLATDSCRKNAEHGEGSILSALRAPTPKGGLTNNTDQTDIVRVLGVDKDAAGSAAKVIFSRHEGIYHVSDAVMLSALEAAVVSGDPLYVTFNPWQGTISAVNRPSPAERATYLRRVQLTGAKPVSIESLGTTDEAIDHYADMGVINETTPGLTPAIPDMATAQTIFNFFAANCCANPASVTIDYCISYQYCEDGCYARAHKMCYLLNNKYHYATQKVFSFSLGGSNQLSVHAEKWGGCCVNWWYHVAPLVTINTPKGPKAYVFDPAMFDSPVPLASWLHAQTSPTCSSSPKVTTISIQPTSAYAPEMYGVTTLFDTDPLYADTDTTMVNYRSLRTCP